MDRIIASTGSDRRPNGSSGWPTKFYSSTEARLKKSLKKEILLFTIDPLTK